MGKVSIEKEKEKKKVNITQEEKPETSMAYSTISMYSTTRMSRMSFMAALDQEVLKFINARKDLKVYEVFDGERMDVTPKPVHIGGYSQKFHLLKERIRRHPLFADSFLIVDRTETGGVVGTRATLGRSIGGLRLSMDDIILGIGSYTMMAESRKSLVSEKKKKPLTKHPLPFIRVVLQLSEGILLYQQYSMTAIKDTKEGTHVEADNKTYDHLTIGKGKVRRRSEAEAQTDDILVKSRDSNTIRTFTADHGTYVSFFEMYDTYQEVEHPIVIDEDHWAITRLPYAEQCAMIMKSPNFKLSEMVVARCLAGNVHEAGQRRFRNMNPPNPAAQKFDFRYTLNLLFEFSQPALKKERKAVVDLSFCPQNGDIVAVSYGIYSFSSMHVPNAGHVFIWNIKNPNDPERKYFYNVPVVTVEFSPFVSTLLAVGLYDGSVEVRDITQPNAPAIAVSQRTTSPGVEPVMAIKWVKQSGSSDAMEIDPFLSLSQDGSVTKFRVINSPYLLGFKQMMLDRIEGEPEGLTVRRIVCGEAYEANRHPQGLSLTVHPLHTDIYYVLTDEGCLLKCSTNYTHQYLEVWKTHDGAVCNMDFSPWSPKLFLTCGNDWCIRIWVDGIFKPLLTLTNHLAPLHCAYWSHTHSTVIVSINRNTVDIWDIKRNTLKPVASTVVTSSHNTQAKISRCGRSLGLGTERGSLLMCAFDEMPFPPHFQYDELEKALFKAIATSPDLIIELKSVGFFGYPHKAYKKPV